MNAYYKETEKPFGYLLVDNKSGTPPDNQILADLFGKCYGYHLGVNNTDGFELTCVETKPAGKNSTTTKTTSSGKLQTVTWSDQTTCGKTSPWEHRQSVRFPKDMLS